MLHVRNPGRLTLHARIDLVTMFNGSRVKVFLLVILVQVGLYDLRAQSFSMGDDIIGPTVGIGGQYTTHTIQTPVVGIAYEHGVTPLGAGMLGIGGYVGFKNLLYRSLVHVGEAEWKYTYLIMGVRGAWHWNQWHGNDRLDTYSGVMIHYNKVKASYSGPELASPGFTAKSGVEATLFVGGRYRLGQHWGVQAELGFGSAVLNLGAAYKF